MDDLFNQFRKNLEGRPEPRFDKRDWQNLEKQLGPSPEKRRGAFSWWFALPLLLLMTGSNAFFFWQWKKTEKQVSTLEIRRDTIYHTQVIHTTDTIYRTRVIRERVLEYQNSYAHGAVEAYEQSGNLENSQQSRLSGENSEQSSINTALQPRVPADKGLPAVQKTAQPGATDVLNRDSSSEQAWALQRNFNNQVLATLPNRSIRPVIYHQPKLSFPNFPLDIPAIQKKKTLMAHLYQARPKGFLLGVSGGLAFPFGKGLESKTGNIAGIHAAIEFSPRLRLWGEAAYLKSTFITKRMGDDIGVPIEVPPSAEYTFLQAEVPQPYLQYALGMQYLFRAKHKLKPFVGIGMGAISLQPYDVTYEFKNTSLDIEWNLDKTINGRAQGLITNFLVLPFGLEYKLSRHWNMQVQATYRYNWKVVGLQLPSMLGLHGGINYKF